MSAALNVYALPKLVTPEQLTGGTVVVIDVLRASTTMIHAVEAGVREIVPCVELDEARQAAAGFPPEQVILAGERMGAPIAGFDLGNSPTDYTSRSVGGRTLVLTTTNGTLALASCHLASRVLIGAFVNAAAVCDVLAEEPEVHLLCAGRLGQVGRDDLLAAGLLVDRLQRRGNPSWSLDDGAFAAREAWLQWQPEPKGSGDRSPEPEALAAELLNSPGGRNLTSLGMEADILTAAQIDRFDRIPEMDLTTMRIR